MKLLILILSLVCLTGSLHAQVEKRVPALVEKEIAYRQLDTFMTFKQVCTGYIVVDTCYLESPTWLFWQKQGRYFARRFDHCDTLPVMELHSDNPFAFYQTHADSIDVEQIRVPTYTRTPQKGSKVAEDITTDIDHDCWNTVTTRQGERLGQQIVPQFYLDTKEVGPGQHNKYYEANRLTNLYALIMQLQAWEKKSKPVRKATRIRQPRGSID